MRFGGSAQTPHGVTRSVVKDGFAGPSRADYCKGTLNEGLISARRASRGHHGACLERDAADCQNRIGRDAKPRGDLAPGFLHALLMTGSRRFTKRFVQTVAVDVINAGSGPAPIVRPVDDLTEVPLLRISLRRA